MWRRLFLVPLLILVLPASAALANPEPAISVLNNEPLKVSGKKGEDTVEVKFSVLNTGAPASVNVKFQASSDERVTVQSWNPESLATGATRLVVKLGGVEGLSEAATGQLVVEGGNSTVAQSVEIDPSPPDKQWPLALIVGSLLAAFAGALAVLRSLGSDRKALANAAPDPKWSFSSWATTLTAIGAAFATVLNSVTLPTFPENISKEELVNLNIFFGFVVLLGPFVFEGLRRYKLKDAADRKARRTGTNFTLLLASTITFWAVLGELGSLSLLGWELLHAKKVAVYLLMLALLCIAALAFWYFFTTTREQVTRDWKHEEEEAKKEAREQGCCQRPSFDSWPIL